MLLEQCPRYLDVYVNVPIMTMYHICPFIILSFEKTTSLTPDKDTPTCLPIFLKLCMLKTKPNGSLGISTGRANHCEH